MFITTYPLPLAVNYTLNLPSDAEVHAVLPDNATVCILATIDNEKKMEPREFLAVRVPYELSKLPTFIERKFIGACDTVSGRYACFELIRTKKKKSAETSVESEDEPTDKK